MANPLMGHALRGRFMKINFRAMFAALLMLLPTLAQAQVLDLSPEPKIGLSDDIGVNLTSAKLDRLMGQLTIGPSDSPRLSYPIFSTSFRVGGGSPLHVRYSESCRTYGGVPGCIYQTRYYSLGGETEIYYVTPPSQEHPGKTNRGSFVQSDGSLVRSDGSIWRFGNGGLTKEQLDAYGLKALVSSIEYPDGETLTYNYSQGELISVESSTGYVLYLEGYGKPNSPGRPEKVTLYNRSKSLCTDCSVSNNSWPILVFNWGQGVATATRTVDDIARTITVTSNSVPDGNRIDYTRRHTSAEGVWFEYRQKVFPPYMPSNPPYTSGEGIYYCDARSELQWVKTPTAQWNYQVEHHSNQFSPCWGNNNISKVISTAHDGVVQSWVAHSWVMPSENEWSWVESSFEDGADRITQLKQSNKNNLSYGKIVSVVYPEKNEVQYNYSTRGNWIGATAYHKTDPNQTISVSANLPTDCTIETAKICNKPTYTVDARGNRTDYTYDARHGGVLTETLPADAKGVRPQKRYTYQQLSARYKNGSGQLVSYPPIWKLVSVATCKTRSTCAGTEDEIVTSYSYDDNLLPTKVTVKTGTSVELSTTITAYDHVGNVVSIDGPAEGTADTTYYFYNEARERIGEIGPDPDGSGPLPRPATHTSYDRDGRPVKVETGGATGTTLESLKAMAVYQTVTFAYDMSGRKIKQTVIAGGATQRITQYSYDVRGRLICTAVRMNPNAYGSLPADACEQSAPGPYGPDRITKNSYDTAGQLTKIEKGYGTPLRQDYAKYTYSPNGKQTSVTDANGNRAEFTYDGFDRQTHWFFPSKTEPGKINTADYEQYGYDANGNRTSLRKRDGRVINFTYDSLNRLTLKDIPGGTAADVYYGYDLRGLQTYARFGSATGQGLANEYDSLGRLTKSTTNVGGVSRALAYQYDVAGNRTRLTYPDGLYIQYDYDTLNRMTAVRENGVTSGAGVLATISYDELGRRKQLIRGNGVVTNYGYDAVSRLANLGHDSQGGAGDVSLGFGYSPASQMISRSINNNQFEWNGDYNVTRPYTVNGLNQYITSGPLNLAYDANGNLTSDGSWTFGFDVDNRWVSARGSRSVDLVYDPAGRLNQIAADSAVTQFLYDGDALVGEYASSGTLLRRYVHGPGVDEPLVWYEASGTTDRRWLLANHQGSIIGESNGSGTVTRAYSYGPYGEPNTVQGSRFRYTGQIIIPEVGLYHYKARAYSPYLGRFLQTDPIGYKDQMNLYAYVHKDPVNNIDPTGKTCTKTNGEWTCKVDNVDRSKLNKSQLAQLENFEKRYTNVVKRLLSQPDKKVTIKPSGYGYNQKPLGQFEITRREAANNLINRTFSYKPGDTGGGPNVNGYTTGTVGPTGRGEVVSHITDRGLSGALSSTIVHEGALHGSAQEYTSGLVLPHRSLFGVEPYRTEHQVPFRDASCELLDGC